MKKISVSLFLTLLLVATFAVSACQPSAAQPASTTAPQPTQAGDKQPASAPTPENYVSKDIVLDPALATDEESLGIDKMVYETLIGSQDGKFSPDLASGIQISADNLDYILTLESGVTFHDGTPFNADAVVANFNRWFDPSDPLHGSGDYATWKSLFGGFKQETGADGKLLSTYDGIQKVDEQTVLIHINQPDPDFLSKLSNPALSIVSPTALEAGNLAGTGPYKITNLTDQGFTLEPNPDYRGEVPIDSMTYGFK